MSWWKPDLELLPGEVIEWKRGAARSIQERTTNAGMLYVTSMRVVFVPNVFNLRSRSEWETSRSAIAAVDEKAPTHVPFSGGMRRRLTLELRDGSEQFFVVNKVEQAVPAIRSLLDVERE
jgi:hypothetical protein